ncbi:MAG TPA: hypothetical protein VM012_10680 [Flavitalea sp.]|nr:hypothetical protein [Flavitalea sp.]
MKILSNSTTQSHAKTPSLIFCIVMDLIGYASFAIPILGEAIDLIWAPISALIYFRTFGGWKGAFGGIFNFVEEILPGLDFIPTFTITWIWQNVFSRKEIKQTRLQRLV